MKWPICYISMVLICCILDLQAQDTPAECLCGQEQSVIQAIRGADWVGKTEMVDKNRLFKIDTLVSYKEDSTKVFTYKTTRLPIFVYTLKVEETFVGEEKDTVFLYTGMEGEVCANRFAKEEEYVVYGREYHYFGNTIPEELVHSEALWSNVCTRTGEYSKKEKKLIFKNLKKWD